MSGHYIRLAGSICLLALFFACNNQPEQRVTTAPDNIIDSTQADTTTSAVPLVQNGHTHTIEISKMKFNPDELAIPAGDTVIWVNNDITNHCVTEANKKWTSSALVPGQSWKKVISKNTDYYCAIHMVMKGRITVK